MERKVTMIPPTINPQTHLPKTQKVKRKVAGYARVSTDFEEQLTSYAAQTRASVLPAWLTEMGSIK